MSVHHSATVGRGRGRLARRALLGGAAVLALTVTAACSSSGGSSGNGGGGGAAGSGAGNDSGLVKQMQALIDQNSGEPKFTPPGPSLDGSKLKGKTVALIAIDLRVPALTQVVDAAKGIAQQVGMKTTVFDGQSNPTQVNQGMTQAINSHVDAIISVGLPVQIIGTQLKTAKADGIPVIDVVNTPPKKGVPGEGSDPNVFGNVAPDSDLVGRLLAATAIVQTKADAHVAIMNTSELTVAPVLVGAMEQTLKKCSSCDYTTTDTALNDWSTRLPDQAASVIRSKPDVNFVLPIYDNMSLFATTGVRQAGGNGKVHMASFNGTAAALALVKTGDIMVADVAQNNDWAAWAAMDQAMRGMLKLEPADPVLPTRYVDTGDLKGVDTSSQDKVNEALFGTAYRDGFLQLWGLK
jgi:ribose transport system substrate-binding protein